MQQIRSPWQAKIERRSGLRKEERRLCLIHRFQYSGKWIVQFAYKRAWQAKDPIQ